MAVPLVLPSTIDLEGIFAANNNNNNNNNNNTHTRRSPPKKIAGISVNSAMASSRIPGSSLEWRKALAEVKRDYLNRKYRSCSTRCDDLLSGVRTSGRRTVEAVHLIYIHFYAASALEVQVRSLHHASSYRLRLLDRARDHYRRASILAEAETETAAQLLSSGRSASSASSSHSPVPSVSSISSRCGSESTRMSTPTPDTADESEAAAAPPSSSKPRRKQVSFENVATIIGEEKPMIRPDSPTLGMDWSPGWSVTAPDDDVPPLELAPGQDKNDAAEEIEKDQDAAIGEEAEETEDTEPDPFERTRRLHRYASALAALHRQITTVHLPACEAVSSAVPPPPSNDEMRAIELRARIARLKAEGWPRRRFDAARYEALREAALADLMD